MAVELLMPRLGWTMEEGVFVQWLKQDGEQVRPGDLLYTIEGDKASSDIESFETGILRIPPDAPTPGATLLVGALLGYIVQPGETAPFEASDHRPLGELNSGTAEPQNQGITEPRTENPEPIIADEHRATMVRTTDYGLPTTDSQPWSIVHGPSSQGHQLPATSGAGTRRSPAISPRARRVAAELGVGWAGIAGSGRTGRIVERDIRAAAQRRPVVDVRASPLARRLAEELGVDLTQIAARQPGRRIERSDVEQAARAAPVPAAASAPPVGAASAATQPPSPSQTAAMSGVRRIIAARLSESAHTTVPVTLTTEADATELVRLRGLISADLDGNDMRAPSYTDLLTRIVAITLIEHPALNATLSDGTITQHHAAHIGVAVDSERGLLVPVIRDAQSKSVQQIAAESARLIGQARAGQSSHDDLRGGTFTITNLGMYEIDAFTPVINLPECAILGVGRIIARPVVVDEQAETIAVRKMMALSLTFDHRLVDGAPAARFLQRLKHLIERPYAWLIR
jgi:pyruvate dehydrogenase E2 component (dihydrolipoamide acetyltransferase)